jgi:hypothetical protein
MKKFLFFIVIYSIFSSSIFTGLYAQTTLPLNYSPDGPINSIITKGDTLIVGGNFNHVGKYTGGGALLSPNTDEPDLLFPKINGTIKSSSSDGNGGFYILGSFFKESENASESKVRIEHILANNTFNPNFSLTLSSPHINHILYHNGILYIGSDVTYTIDGQAVDKLSAINVTTKAIQSWIPALTVSVGNTAVNRIFAKGHSLYIIGNFGEVGGIAREDAAAIQIGTGTVKAWNPRPNWVNYISYADMVFYNDKIVIGGSFNNNGQLSVFKHACAIVDTLSGQNFNYLFVAGGLFGNNGEYLYWGAVVSRLQIKDNTLFAYTWGTFDTRVTALNLNIVNLDNPPYGSGYLWIKYFNVIAQPEEMVVIDNSLFLMGSYFEKVYTTNQNNDPANFERDIIGGAKLDLATGNLQNWFPNPTDWNWNFIWTMSVSNNKIFIGGNFTHLNSHKRVGVYMYNTATETVLPFKIDFKLEYPSTEVNSMKLSGENLYVGGGLSWLAQRDYSILGFNLNSGNILNWYPPNLGFSSQVNAIEVNNQFVFVGGNNLSEPAGGLGRINLFAVDKVTGVLNSWSPNPNFAVLTLSLSHNQLYVGGGFTNISGQNRNRVASFDISNLSLNNWNPNSNSAVYAIHPKGGVMWLAGNFSNVGGANRNNIAGVDPFTSANNINSTTNFFGSPLLNLNSKGCKLFIGGRFQASNTSNCRNLSIFDLNTNSLISPNNFCLAIDSQSPSIIRSTAFIGNDLYFAGTFTKINNDSKNISIGRIRFPSNYFADCEISNCGNEVSLTSTVDDFSAGNYLQKTNLGIKASNKSLGNSKVTLQSNSSILLLPNTNNNSGFVAQPTPGGSFKAEIKPCN